MQAKIRRLAFFLLATVAAVGAGAVARLPMRVAAIPDQSFSQNCSNPIEQFFTIPSGYISMGASLRGGTGGSGGGASPAAGGAGEEVDAYFNVSGGQTYYLDLACPGLPGQSGTTAGIGGVGGGGHGGSGDGSGRGGGGGGGASTLRATSCATFPTTPCLDASNALIVAAGGGGGGGSNNGGSGGAGGVGFIASPSGGSGGSVSGGGTGGGGGGSSFGGSGGPIGGQGGDAVTVGVGGFGGAGAAPDAGGSGGGGGAGAGCHGGGGGGGGGTSNSGHPGGGGGSGESCALGGFGTATPAYLNNVGAVFATISLYQLIGAQMSFNPTTIAVNQTSMVTITLTNPNPDSLSGVSFSDGLPSGLQLASQPNFIDHCVGTDNGTGAGSTFVDVLNGFISGSSSCSVSFVVVATSTGMKTNTTGSVSATQLGENGNTQASATLTVTGAAACSGGTPYQNLNGNWLAIPGAVNLLGADRNGNGTTSVWALGTNQVPGGCGIYQYIGGAATWAPINGGASYLTVDATGEPWVLQSANNHAIYQFAGGSFSAIPGAAYEISAGAGGDVWVIGTNLVGSGGHGIYRYVGAPNYWQPINGAANHIAVAPDNSIWVLQTNGAIYHYSGGFSGTWTAIPGQAQQISVGYDGSVYVIGTNLVNSGGYGIYKYVGGAATWQAINGSAIQIAGAGANEFWVHQGGSVPVVPNAISASGALPFVAPLPVAVKPTPTPSPQAVNPPSQASQKSPPSTGNTLPVPHP